MKIQIAPLVIKLIVFSSACIITEVHAVIVPISGDTIITGPTNDNNDYRLSHNNIVPPNLKVTVLNTAISSFSDVGGRWDVAGDRVLTFSTARVANGIRVQTEGSRLIINGSHIFAGTEGMGVFIGGGSLNPPRSAVAIIQDSVIENNSTGGFYTADSALVANVKSDVTIERSKLISTTGSGLLSIFSSAVNLKDSSIKSKNAGLDIQMTNENDTPGQYTINNSSITSSDSAAISISLLGGPEPINPLKNNFFISNGSTLAGKDNKLFTMSGHVVADITVNNSHLTGDIDMDTSAGGSSTLTLENSASIMGQFTGLSSVALNSRGTWVMTHDSSQKSISMNGGSVSFGDASAGFKTLEVENLSGSGEFIMNTNVTTGRSDFLNVTGRADGSYQLNVLNTGVEPTKNDDGQLHLVHIADGTASFGLKNHSVDIGVWQYGLKKQGNDWYLSPDLDGGDGDVGDGGSGGEDGNNGDSGQDHLITSPSTDAILSMANVSRQIFYGEMDALRTHNHARDKAVAGESRVWANYLSNNTDQKGDMSSRYRLEQNGVVLGAEHGLEMPFGQAVAGVFAVNSLNSVKHARGGKSNVKSWGVGAYGTLYLTDGYYVDITMKANSFDNDLHASMTGGESVIGSFNQFGYGIDAEAGKKFDAIGSVWMTPYLRSTWFQASGAGVTLNNGMQAEISSLRSLQGEAGVRAGKDFIGKSQITPYVMLAAVQEFVTANHVDINDTGFNNDLSGSSIKTGVGINARVAGNLEFSAEANYMKGNKVESPIIATVGVSYNF